jgi:hypothetical protein
VKKRHVCRGLCNLCYNKEQRAKIRARVKDVDAKVMAAMGGRPLEWNEERINKEADDLIAWSIDEDKPALVLEEFGLYRDPPYIRSLMYKLAEKSESFRDALLIAKERIRSRKEGGAYKNIYNAQFVAKMHGHQDRHDNDKDLSFTEYQERVKASEKAAEGEGMAQAFDKTKTFVEDARKRLEERKKAKKKKQKLEEDK